jgi:hypothetical protein
VGKETPSQKKLRSFSRYQKTISTKLKNMKKTLAELLNPAFNHYRSIGELAKALQFLLRNADDFRAGKRFDSHGPTEVLTNHDGCRNCLNYNWSSLRINTYTGRDTATWQEAHDSLYQCILSALCKQGPAEQKWRETQGISLTTLIKTPMAYQNSREEQDTWEDFLSLHKFKLGVKTLNSCHRGVNILCEPSINIGRDAIWIDTNVTLRSEMKISPRCYSRWNTCFLLRDTKKHSTPPKWNCHRETFAKFLTRATDFYKGITTD